MDLIDGAQSVEPAYQATKRSLSCKDQICPTRMGCIAALRAKPSHLGMGIAWEYCVHGTGTSSESRGYSRLMAQMSLDRRLVWSPLDLRIIDQLKPKLSSGFY
jgi:hypothetical protein